MKYLKLIWRNAARNRRRAVLTVLSVSIAMVAIAILQTIITAFSAGLEMADATRLIVREATAIIFPLPLAYRQKIAAIPGVRSVAISNWFGGVYQDKKQFFPRFAIDAETYLPMYPEFGIPPEQLAEFLKDRKGCIVGRKIADRYGLKVGGTIPIRGDIYPGDWEFNVRAIYEGRKQGTDETWMFFHWKYLDESRPKRQQGQVGIYVVQLENPSQAGRIAKTIDALFENSPNQTLTETEKAFQTEWIRMMGNIEVLVRAIGGAVIFALVLVAANTMAMAARERTTEIAILKTLGFTRGLLAALVAAEGILLTLAGWALGMGLAWMICRGIETSMPNLFPIFSLQASTVLLALAVAVLTGLVSSLFPAVHAARTSIVNAMREVA